MLGTFNSLHLQIRRFMVRGCRRFGKWGKIGVGEVPKVDVRPGYTISKLIKGGWQLSGDHGAVDGEDAIADMIQFVDAGVTTFDCADIYTGVEEMIGRFRTMLADAQGTDALAAIKVHTKHVPDRESLTRLTLSDVETGIDRSLSRLQTERLDLVQFHWWDYSAPAYVEAVQHLDRLRAKGKIDQIGVTNFDGARLAELSDAVDIASAQVQISLLDRRTVGDFASLAHGRNISLFAYGVLAGGFLTDAWLGKPDPGFEFVNRSLVKYRLIIEEFGGWGLFQELLRVLRAVADRHEVEISTIAVRATLDMPQVTATIVGARYANRLPRTLRAFEISLSEQDQSEIQSVLAQAQGPNGPVYGLERDIEGPHGRIMKYNLNKGDDRLASEEKVANG